MWRCTVYWYGGARTAAERMCAVARYNDISSKADRGDIFIRDAAEQMGGFNCKKSECDVTWPRWPILWILALHLTHPKCTHSEHTHTHREHTPAAVGSQCFGARGAVGGSVPCSRAPQSWYWRWRERCTFTPPTNNSQPVDYESNSLPLGHNFPPCCAPSLKYYESKKKKKTHLPKGSKYIIEL